MLALPYQTCATIGHIFHRAAIRVFRDVTEVRAHVENVVPVEPGELKLPALAYPPNIIEDQCAIRRLFLLLSIDRVAGDGDVDRDQSRLMCEPVIADP